MTQPLSSLTLLLGLASPPEPAVATSADQTTVEAEAVVPADEPVEAPVEAPVEVTPESEVTTRQLLAWDEGANQWKVDGTDRYLSDAEFWALVGEPDQYDRFRRRRRVGVGLLVPGALLILGSFLPFAVLGSCADGPDDGEEESSGLVVENCSELNHGAWWAAGGGLLAGGLAFAIPGAILFHPDSQRKAQRDAAGRHNRAPDHARWSLPTPWLGRSGAGLSARFRF